MSGELDVRTDGPVARMAFTRPDLGNAVTTAQAAELCAALEDLIGAGEAQVLILTGSGSSFNVGAYRPPTDPEGGPPLSPAERVERYAAQLPVMQRVIELLASPGIVTIASINGACAGAGLALALAADLRYAADTAGFNTAFLQAGLPGELEAIRNAVRLVGLGRARELFLLPGRVWAPRMAEIGLVNGTFPPAELEASVDAIAARIASMPAAALNCMKANFGDAVTASCEDYRRNEFERMLKCLAER